MGFKIVTYALPLCQDEKDLIVKVPGQGKIELTAGKRKRDTRKESPKGTVRGNLLIIEFIFDLFFLIILSLCQVFAKTTT